MRVDNWQKNLSLYLEEKRNEPFCWGRNDCILFGAGAVEAITGNNYYSDYIGYESEVEALEIIKDNGGIEGILKNHLGRHHVNPLLARRGDLVMFKMPLKTIGVVDDSGERIACVTKEGMVFLPLSSAIKVWRVD